MAQRPWAVVFEGHGPLAVGSRRLVERLVSSAGADPARLVYVAMPVHLGQKAGSDCSVCGQKTRGATTEARQYADRLRAEIDALDPERVLTLGPLALLAVRGDAKKPVVSRERGRLQRAGDRLLLPTMTPAQVFGDPEYIRDFGADVLKWASQDEPVDFPYPDFELAVTLGGLREALRPYRDTAVLSLDIETTGFDPRTDELLCVGLGSVDGHYVVVSHELLVEQRDAVLDLLWETLWPDPLMRVVLHNGKFDLQFLTLLWGAMPDEDGARLGDTMLLSFLLDERPARSKYRAHGLKDLARTRYDVPDYGFDHDDFQARYAAGELAEEDWEDFYAYQAMDAKVTAHLWRDLVGEAREEDRGLLRAHDDLMAPATLAFADVELNGLPVDREFLLAEKGRLERRLARREAALRGTLKDPGFRPGSPKQVAAVIRSFPVLPPREDQGTKINNTTSSTYVKYRWLPRGEGEPINPMEPVHWPRVWKGARQGFVDDSTSVGEIRLLLNEFLLRGKKREARVMDMILKWRLDQKYLRTYVDGLLEGLDDQDRVHASFNLAGAVTGRLSSSRPNMHAVPKRGAGFILNTRKMFRAEPGWAFLEADYSQLELRVAALLSGDALMQEVYREGRDLHLEVASKMFHRPPEAIDYQQRYMAKAVDFGIVYGRSALAISQSEAMYYLVHELGGTAWTEEEAQGFIDNFLDGFPDLRDWMRAEAERIERERVVVTPFGRRRRFYTVRQDGKTRASLRRQGVNTPIQSVASDICLSAVIRLWRELDPDDARILSMVHDSILLEVREEALHRVAPEVRRLMETEPEQLRGSPVPFAVDLKVGPTLFDDQMHDYEPEEQVSVDNIVEDKETA